MATKIKKFKAKTHKSSVKRIKITAGGDLSKGKLIVRRKNRKHRMIGKQRERVLKGRTDTVLKSSHLKFKIVL